MSGWPEFIDFLCVRTALCTQIRIIPLNIRRECPCEGVSSFLDDAAARDWVEIGRDGLRLAVPELPLGRGRVVHRAAGGVVDAVEEIFELNNFVERAWFVFVEFECVLVRVCGDELCVKGWDEVADHLAVYCRFLFKAEDPGERPCVFHLPSD